MTDTYFWNRRNDEFGEEVEREFIAGVPHSELERAFGERVFECDPYRNAALGHEYPYTPPDILYEPPAMRHSRRKPAAREALLALRHETLDSRQTSPEDRQDE